MTYIGNLYAIYLMMNNSSSKPLIRMRQSLLVDTVEQIMKYILLII